MGNRKGLSNHFSCTLLTEDKKLSMNEGKAIGVILQDFRKVFDSVGHNGFFTLKTCRLVA